MQNLSQMFGGGGVKSVQRGWVDVPSANTSATVAVSAVDTTKSIVLITTMVHGVSNTVSYLSAFNFTAVLASPTQINFNRGHSGMTVSVAWQLIEFK